MVSATGERMSYLRYVNSHCDGQRLAGLIGHFLYGQGIDARVTNIQDDPYCNYDIVGNICVDHINAHANLNIDLAKVINRHVKLTVGVESYFCISNLQHALARRPSRHKRVKG